MVSAYAQSGKLFEDRRAANIRQVTVATTTHGGGAATNVRFRKNALPFRHDTPQANGTQERKAVTDPDGDWLNRVPPSAQRHASAHPVVVEAPFDDIPMSQLTDDNTSQHSGSQNNSINPTAFMPNNRPPYNLSARQRVQSIGRFQPSATPIRQPPASRFSHLTTPRHQQQQQRNQQHHAVVSKPRATISVGSSSASYQPRSLIKKATPRPWNPQSQHFGTTSSTTPFTPMRGASKIQTREARPFLLSQSSLATSIDTSRNSGQDKGGGGRFSFSRTAVLDTSNVQLNSHASSRSSIAVFQASSDKLVKAQMQVLEDRAKVIQDMISKAHTSAVTEVNAVKLEAANELEEARNTLVREIEKRASELQAEKSQRAKATFETQQAQLVDWCLPMLREKATSIITNLIQVPSVLKMVEKLFNRSKYVIRNEVSSSGSCLPDKSRSSKESTPTKTRTNRINDTNSFDKVATPQKPKLRPIQFKIVSTKKVVTTTKKPNVRYTDSKATSNKVVTSKAIFKCKATKAQKAAPPRRSKRKAAQKLSQSTAIGLPEEEEDFIARASPIAADISTKKRKIVDSRVPTVFASIRRNVAQLTTPKPSQQQCVEEEDLVPIRTVEWMMPNRGIKKKRKHLFGRLFSDHTDCIVTSTLSPLLPPVVVSSQKKLKSGKCRARAIPSIQVWPKKGSRYRKKSTIKRSLATDDASDCFDFRL